MDVLQREENVDKEWAAETAHVGKGAYRAMYVDMHTHSEHSHDSFCRIEDMCLAQIKKGTQIMAVTDHCDVYSYGDYDIYSPIKRVYETVAELNEKYKGQIQLLSGVEISEGFWFPEEYEKIQNLVPYDVILGSVHCVQYKDMIKAYSTMDFSKLSEKVIYEYLDAYFDDIMKMLDTTDIDVLTHLTCPLRYITGKYGIGIDFGRFSEKITKILQRIIEEEIALEINTSSYVVLNDFMPCKEIVKQYKEMGGYIITMGSDAHVVENAVVNFEKAVEFLKEIGIKEIYYYKKRKKYACSL